MPAPNHFLEHDPATDEEIADYREGIWKGVMKNATPNVVASLITRIERDRKIVEQLLAACAAAERFIDPDSGPLYDNACKVVRQLREAISLAEGNTE